MCEFLKFQPRLIFVDSIPCDGRKIEDCGGYFRIFSSTSFVFWKQSNPHSGIFISWQFFTLLQYIATEIELREMLYGLA